MTSASATKKTAAGEKTPEGATGGSRGSRNSRHRGGGETKTKTKFTGKTEDMMGHIYDVGADKSKQFTDTHRELYELIGRSSSYKKSADAYTAVKELRKPNFVPPAPPIYVKADPSGGNACSANTRRLD